MQKRQQTKTEIELAEKMRLALIKEHNGHLNPEPQIVSAFRKETLRI
jgi:hypothetical protein